MNLQHEIGKRQPFSCPEEETLLNILRAAAILEAPHDALFKSRGLSSATYNILRILRGEQLAGRRGVPMATIGERLIARVPDVTRLVDRLERAGLAERCRTPDDRRIVLVSITQHGRNAVDELDEPLAELHRRQLGHLSREELGQLNHLLTRARSPQDQP